MRRTASKGRKTNSEEFDQATSTTSNSLQMELMLLGMKAKNNELTQAHARLTHENFEMRDEIFALRRELVEAEAKSNRLEAVVNELSREMKRCTPSLIDILNLFLQVADKSTLKPNSLSDRSLGTSFTPIQKTTVTHTVKPHTVNGTVLNLNPTISLTRLNSGENQEAGEGTSRGTGTFRTSLPSTSASPDNQENEAAEAGSGSANVSSDVNGGNNSVANGDFVVRRSQLNYRNSSSLNMELEGETEEPEDQEVEEESEEQSSSRKLSTIHEESITATTGKSRTSLGEIRICLSRLSSEELQTSGLLNDTRTSTEANINDTCLNIETTVIENQELGVNKGLRADIMVFSPHTNSTRLENDASPMVDMTPINTRQSSRTFTMPAIGTVSSSLNDTDLDQTLTPNPITWTPTPSISAMGGIEKSYSRLDILSETERNRKSSPRPPRVSSPLRCTRSKSRRRLQTSENQFESPSTSRESQSSKRLTQFVSRQRGSNRNNSKKMDAALSPAIILVRLEHCSLEGKSPVIQECAEKENIADNNETRPKRSKKKARCCSPEKNAKRKKTDPLHDKIREVQIRLSNYLPNNAEELMESPKYCSKRPSRAAKPTMLKDPSLKAKLRRLI